MDDSGAEFPDDDNVVILEHPENAVVTRRQHGLTKNLREEILLWGQDIRCVD